MPNSNLILKIFQFNMADTLPDESKRKVTVLNLFGLISALLFAGYAVLGLINDSYVIVGSSAIGLLTALLTLIFFNRLGKITIATYMMVLGYMIVGLSISYAGAADQYSLLSCYLLPMFCCVLASFDESRINFNFLFSVDICSAILSAIR